MFPPLFDASGRLRKHQLSRCLVKWQAYADLRSPYFAVTGPDRADMLFNELFDDRQAKTRAFWLGRDIGIENLTD